MNDWKQATLGEVIRDGGTIKTGPFGTTLKASEYSDTGVPVISVGEVGYGSLRLRKDTPVVSPETTARLAEYVLNSGDIVFGRKGAVDRSAHVKPHEHGWFLGSDGIRVRLPDTVSSKFVAYQFQLDATKSWLLRHASGSTMLSLNQETLERTPLALPPKSQQQAVAEVLSALDDKIAANTKLANTADDLAKSIYLSSLKNGSYEVQLDTLTSLLTRGITPKYAPEDTDPIDSMTVLNQKCVRDQRVNLVPARRTLLDKVRQEKVLRPNDALVNSTGEGTLGRVARWTSTETVTIDSHLTVVRFDPTLVDQTCAGFEMLRQQQNITFLGEGSTGQTELSRTELGKIKLRLPPRSTQADLGSRLSELANLSTVHLTHNHALAATRDTLLPQLMSGNLRVKDAENITQNLGV